MKKKDVEEKARENIARYFVTDIQDILEKVWKAGATFFWEEQREYYKNNKEKYKERYRKKRGNI